MIAALVMTAAANQNQLISKKTWIQKSGYLTKMKSDTRLSYPGRGKPRKRPRKSGTFTAV